MTRHQNNIRRDKTRNLTRKLPRKKTTQISPLHHIRRNHPIPQQTTIRSMNIHNIPLLRLRYRTHRRMITRVILPRTEIHMPNHQRKLPQTRHISRTDLRQTPQRSRRTNPTRELRRRNLNLLHTRTTIQLHRNRSRRKPTTLRAQRPRLRQGDTILTRRLPR